MELGEVSAPCRALADQAAADQLADWMQQALCDERKEVEKLLVRCHEDMLWRLGRFAVDDEECPVLPSKPLQIPSSPPKDLLCRLGPGHDSLPVEVQSLQVLPSTQTKAKAGHVRARGTVLQVFDANQDAQLSRDTTATKEQDQIDSVAWRALPAQDAEPSASATAWTSEAQQLSSQAADEAAKRFVEKQAKVSHKIQIVAQQAEFGKSFKVTIGDLTSHTSIGHMLDAISGIVIILFILLSAVWTEYRGFDLAFSLAHHDGFERSRPAEQVWPGAFLVFNVLEWVFGLYFCVELFTRMVCRIRLWQDRFWNLLDGLIIAAFVVERMDRGSAIDFNPTILRMARFLRLMRMLKLVRHIHSFDALHLIIKAIQSSMAVLTWTLALLMLLMTIVAMINANLLEDFILDASKDSKGRAEVYERWGTFVRAYVSMFEITLANWGPQCWILVNHVDELWGFFFIAWRCCVGFAVIQVITSVFIQHTFKVASRDEDIMIQEKQKASESYLRHLDRLFTKLDESGDGFINSEEFEAALQDPRVKLWFGALEIDVSDVANLFHLLDDGDGQIDKDEFINGMKKIKGLAQSSDLIHVMKDCQRIRRALGDMDAERRAFSTFQAQSVL